MMSYIGIVNASTSLDQQCGARCAWHPRSVHWHETLLLTYCIPSKSLPTSTSENDPRLSEKTLGKTIYGQPELAASKFTSKFFSTICKLLEYCTHSMYNIHVNSIVVYTAITGGYDSLRQPKVIDLNVDYVCFTDAVSQVQQNGVWKIVPIPKELQYLSDVKKQRVVKICPHRYLKEYDISVWVDGNFSIVGSISQFIKQYDLNKSPLYVRVHPIRKCIYEEAKACIEMHKDLSQTIQNQVSTYRKEGYPKNIGMAETGIVLRRHNDIKCQLVDNLWASELLKYSHRDQLSFNYACWKMHFLPGCLNKEFNVFGNKTFVWRPHGR